MWAALRYRSLNLPKSSASWNQSFYFLSTFARTNEGLLNLQDVEKVLTDVRADDVKVMPVGKQCDWTDFMVVATGRSTWHVKNIAQALIYKAGLFVPSLFSFFILNPSTVPCLLESKIAFLVQFMFQLLYVLFIYLFIIF